MVRRIERLRTDLQIQFLRDSHCAHQRDVHRLQRRSVHRVPPHISKGIRWRRDECPWVEPLRRSVRSRAKNGLPHWIGFSPSTVPEFAAFPIAPGTPSRIANSASTPASIRRGGTPEYRTRCSTQNDSAGHIPAPSPPPDRCFSAEWPIHPSANGSPARSSDSFENVQLARKLSPCRPSEAVPHREYLAINLRADPRSLRRLHPQPHTLNLRMTPSHFFFTLLFRVQPP
jgi:hypothetical protein